LATTVAGLPSSVHAAGEDPYAHKWLVAFGVVLGGLIELIDTSIVNVALAPMSASLGVGIDEITWVTVGYILSAVIILPMTGWFSTYFGRKRYFLGSIILFTVASLFCGLSRSLPTLVFWRIVQGIGGGALMSTAQAILFDAFPPGERMMAAALFGIGMMVGPAIGPTLGGFIVDRWSWPWMFFINLPVGVYATFVIAAFVHDREKPDKPERVDWLGFGLLALGIGSLQFVLERGEHYEWFASPLIVLLTTSAVLCIGTMIWWELRHDHPVLELRLLRDPSLASGAIMFAVLGMGMFGSIFALPIFAQQLLHFDSMKTGLLLLPGAIGSATSMMMISRVKGNVDTRWIIALGAGILGVSQILHSHFDMNSEFNSMIFPVFMRGIGAGLMFVPLTTAALANLHGKNLSQGTAIIGLTRQLGGSIGIAALAGLLTRETRVYSAYLAEHVSKYDPNVQAQISTMTRAFMARGADYWTATQRAIATISMRIQMQAAVLAFEQIFRLVAVLIICTIPLVLILRRPRADVKVDLH
jgi:MFS transporter, DHA2 family, multidrug resistance protein